MKIKNIEDELNKLETGDKDCFLHKTLELIETEKLKDVYGNIPEIYNPRQRRILFAQLCGLQNKESEG